MWQQEYKGWESCILVVYEVLLIQCKNPSNTAKCTKWCKDLWLQIESRNK